jgi:hypothetical protein
VASPSFLAGRWAPSTTTARGMPWPSVTSRRLVPCVPRAVGWGPGPLSPQRRVGHGAIPRLPLPRQAFQSLRRYQPGLPKPRTYPSCPPRLKPGMHGTGGPQAPRQRFPLAARAPHLHDGRHRVPVIPPGASVCLLGVGRGEDAPHLRPQRSGKLSVGAHPEGFLAHPGFLRSDNGRKPVYGVHHFSDRLLDDSGG